MKHILTCDRYIDNAPIHQGTLVDLSVAEEQMSDSALPSAMNYQADLLGPILGQQVPPRY